MLHIVSTPFTPPNAIAGQDETIFLYVVSFFFAALGVISIDTLGNVASGLSGEWVLAFGLATLVPFALELMLERGAGGVFAWLASLASIKGIDLAEAAQKYANGCPRCSGTPCGCTHRAT